MEVDFKEYAKQLENVSKKISQKQVENLFINKSCCDLHTMKIRGELLKNLELDTEFEECDLLDYLGYERIFECNKK